MGSGCSGPGATTRIVINTLLSVGIVILFMIVVVSVERLRGARAAIPVTIVVAIVLTHRCIPSRTEGVHSSQSFGPVPVSSR